MQIVYLLRSRKDPSRVYVGLCKNLKNRLAQHNTDGCKSTAGLGPWEIDVAIWFRASEKARAFERYLKKGSGRAFSKRRF